MAYAQAKTLNSTAIPLIDVAPLRQDGGPASAVTAAAADLHAASQGLGFIYIKGHGIPQPAIAAARAAALEFFRAPNAQKRSVSVSPQHRGWLYPDGARMQDDARPDLKESFIWGYQDTDADANGPAPNDHPLRGANRWPPFVAALEPAAMTYFKHAHDVAYSLMRGFALGLNLPQDFFLRNCRRPLSRASFVYYPPQPEHLGEQQFGVAPHTDFGVLTVLCQDDVGGLQVQDVNGDWLHAPPIDDALVVNVGDLLSRWTDGAYKSTPHRVVNTSARERLSLVLAFDPDPETMIDARAVYGPDCRPKQPPISCGDYLIWRFNKAFSYRSENT